MLLANKVAVLYGAGGSLGGAIAEAFAAEGAHVYLTGRRREPLEAIAARICDGGGRAEVALVDALDEAAVEEHARAVAERAGRIDVSFNLVSRGDVQGIPLLEMSPEQLTAAPIKGLTSQFLTARAAARTMVKQGSGAILMITSGSAAGAQALMGSTPPADAAMEALVRGLAAELGPHGVRVNALWTAAVQETLTPESTAATNPNMVLDEAGIQQLIATIGQMTLLRRAPVLADVTRAAAFLASEYASGITGTITNVTAGMVPF